MIASTFVSMLPREMTTQPGIRPTFTSGGSRTSSSVTGSPRSSIAATSSGVTSVMRAFASLMRSSPVFMRQYGEPTGVGVELGHRAEWNRPLFADVADGDAGNRGDRSEERRVGKE